MSRQVGFAIGVALFVAVFTGAIDNRVADARQEVAASLARSGLSSTQESASSSTAFADPDDPFAERPAPRTPIEEQARAIVNEEMRDAYGAAFRAGALVTLLAFPFALTMRRKPGDVHEGPAGRGRRGRRPAAAAAVLYSQEPMRIAAGFDHAGYPLKQTIVAALEGAGHEVVDCGTDSEESVDYPVHAARAAPAWSPRATPTWPCSRAAPAPGSASWRTSSPACAR